MFVTKINLVIIIFCSNLRLRIKYINFNEEFIKTNFKEMLKKYVRYKIPYLIFGKTDQKCKKNLKINYFSEKNYEILIDMLKMKGKSCFSFKKNILGLKN